MSKNFCRRELNYSRYVEESLQEGRTAWVCKPLVLGHFLMQISFQLFSREEINTNV